MISFKFNLYKKGNSKYEIYYSAHFAEIKHEVKPVTSGYRLVLVYILCCGDKQFDIKKYRIQKPQRGE